MGQEIEPMPPAPHDRAQATEADEETVLEGLYGPPDGYGIFREVAG
ncbi:hypothetical protein [Spirillospora sp. CA-128828]